jgi:alkylation response protein AidB-like acyl-CoA dehydrogenase
MKFREPADLGAFRELRLHARKTIAAAMTHMSDRDRAKSWMASDREFSLRMGDAGFIGMTWPKAYGGHERSALERYVVVEELLAAGAPVNGYWAADRQSGPLLLRYGTEAQKQEIVPRIARGELTFCIGMSEPDSGSDLASVRSRAARTDNGWVINGRKVWTTGADQSHYIIMLVRTGNDANSRHEGLSQFLVDMKTPGITVRPIRSMIGEAEFNEVTFDDVRVPADALLGLEGGGWAQVVGELALERSGPERFMSSHRLLFALYDAIGEDRLDAAAPVLGRAAAHAITLRNMSLSVAAGLEAKEQPEVEAAIVKDLGGRYEQGLVEMAMSLVDDPADPGAEEGIGAVLSRLRVCTPSFTLRGGTTEILRGIIARQMGLR